MNRTLVLAQFVCLVATLCPAFAEEVYVGKIPELAEAGQPTPQLGIVVENMNVSAYVCGKQTPWNQTYSRWMSGKLDAQSNLSAAGEGQSLTGVLQGETSQLTWKVGEKSWQITVQKVPDGSMAGLYSTEYRIDDDEYIVGWVVGLDEVTTGAAFGRRQRVAEAAPAEVQGGRAVARQAARQVKLVRIAFERKPDRRFLLTFTNFGDTPSENRTFSLRILKKENLNAQLGVLQPGETKTVSVQIQRAKLLRLIGDRLRELGQNALQRLRERKRLVEVDVQVELTLDGETTSQNVKIGDETD